MNDDQEILDMVANDILDVAAAIEERAKGEFDPVNSLSLALAFAQVYLELNNARDPYAKFRDDILKYFHDLRTEASNKEGGNGLS